MKKIKRLTAALLAGVLLFVPVGHINAQTTLETAESLVGVQVGTGDDNGVDISTQSLENAECLGSYSSRLRSSPNSITDTLTGTINSEGGMAYVDITLAPNEILQATLKCPSNENLNYDLYLYTYDDEGLFDEPVALSILSTFLNGSGENQTTVDEGISYINETTATKTYALIVYAMSGYSTTEQFILTVSLDEEGYYDSYEPNDSPFTVTELPSSTQHSVTANLNVVNDQDWYCFQMPSYDGRVSVETNVSGYVAEIYKADSSNAMHKVDKVFVDRYNLDRGTWYYLKVYYGGNNFTSSNYTLSINVEPIYPATLRHGKFKGDMGDNTVTYNEGTKERFQTSFYVTFTVNDQDGLPLAGQSVVVTWISGATNTTRTFSALTDEYGGVRVNCTPPSAVGVKSCRISTGFTHHYDVDTLIFTCGSLTQTMTVYHYAYSG